MKQKIHKNCNENARFGNITKQELKYRNYFAVISIVLLSILGAKFEAKCEVIKFEDVALYEVNADNKLIITEPNVDEDAGLVFGVMLEMEPAGEGKIYHCTRHWYSTSDHDVRVLSPISLFKKEIDGSEYWTYVIVIDEDRIVGNKPLWIISPNKKYILSKRDNGFELGKSYITSTADDEWLDNYLKTQYNYRGSYQNTKEYQEFVKEFELLETTFIVKDYPSAETHLKNVVPLLNKLLENPDFKDEYKNDYSESLFLIMVALGVRDSMLSGFK